LLVFQGKNPASSIAEPSFTLVSSVVVCRKDLCDKIARSPKPFPVL
jgi:hypothetical protein